VVAEVGVVDRDDLLQLGEHAQEPAAAAARRPEDPRQAIFPLVQGKAMPMRRCLRGWSHVTGRWHGDSWRGGSPLREIETAGS
jgi:hypothetical protein